MSLTVELLNLEGTHKVHDCMHARMPLIRKF